MTPEARDFRRLRTLAAEILEQCKHYQRNTEAGQDDSIRTLLVQGRTREIDRIGRRMARRYLRSRT